MTSSSGTLADFELLLPDSRVEQLWSRLMKLFMKLPNDTMFATYIQPEATGTRPDGSIVRVPETAVFMVVSPNPHPRHKTEMLKSVASMTMDTWRAEEDENWRFVGKGDPAFPIFKALCIEHLNARKNWSELM